MRSMFHLKMKPNITLSGSFISAIVSLVLGAILYTTLLGCTPKSSEQSASSEAPQSQGKKVVNLAIWGDYISPALLQKFKEQTGIEVVLSNYSSNEELLAKVLGGNSGIDLAVPSDYMVGIMIKLGLLSPLDHSLLENKKNVMVEFLSPPYDAGNLYSFPYAWATSGIAYNKTLVTKPIRSWKDVLSDNQLNGKISLLDDVREVMGVALKMNGKSVNSVDPKELEDAKAVLLKLKAKSKMFRSDTVQILADKEVAVAHAYSSSALIARSKTNGQIEFVIPSEGAIKSVDNMVIFKGAPHIQEAHALMNFMLTEEASLAFVQSIFGGPVIQGVQAKLPKDLAESPALFPSQKIRANLESLVDVGENSKLFDDIWTQIKVE